MEYVDNNGERFELPKYTLSLAEAFSEASGACDGLRGQVSARLKVVKQCVGADYVSKRCGGKTAETVDVAELNALFAELREAFDAPALEAAARQLEAVKPILEAYRSMSVANPQKSRQGFSRVR